MAYVVKYGRSAQKVSIFYVLRGKCGLSLMSSPNLDVDTLLAERLFLLGQDLCVNLRTFGGFIAVIACLRPQAVSHVPIFA